MRRLALPFFLFPGLLPLALAGCSEGYSPDTYAADAAQQEATVQRGVIIGVRPVLISASGTIGGAAGGAAGGVVGAQVGGSPVATAFGAIGGALVGGVGGAAAEQAVADAKGWEYIVEVTGSKLVSITQTSKTALSVGLHVLVIAGKDQARIVPDYTVHDAAASPSETVRDSAAEGVKPAESKATKTAAASPSPASADPAATPLALVAVARAPKVPSAPRPASADPAATPPAQGPVAVAGAPTVPSAPRPASADPAATPLAQGPVAVAGAPTIPSTPRPASADPAATPLAPEAVSNRSSARGTPSARSTATSVQIGPGVSIPIPPVSSSSTARP